MSADARTRLAVDELLAARRDRRRIASLSAAAMPADQEAAYRIQDASIADLLALAGGGAPAGWKIGCTNPTAQRQLGLDAPFRGRLLGPAIHRDGARVAADGFFMRQMEVEFAFRLADDLPADAAPFVRADLEAVIGSVMPALEIVDSRYADWTTIGALALIADNAAHGAWVQGPETAVGDWSKYDLSGHATALVINGEVRDRGSGGNVLGDPFNVLVWLANHLAASGHALARGDLVTTGTTTLVLPVEAGDSVRGDFGPLGQVGVSFV